MSIERKQRRQAIRELRKTAGISRRDAKTAIDLSIAQQNAYDRYNQGNVATQMLKPSEASQINQDWKENGEDGAMYHPVGDTFQDPTELQASTVSAERPASQEQLDFNRNIREGTDAATPWVAGALAGSYGLANILGSLGAIGGASKIGGVTNAAKIAQNITSKYAKAYDAPLKSRKVFNAIHRGMERVSPYMKKVAPVLEKFSPGYWVENAANKAGMRVVGNLADKVDLIADAVGIAPGFIHSLYNTWTDPEIDTPAKVLGEVGKTTVKDWGLWSLPIFSGAFGRKAHIINYLNDLDGKYIGEVPEFKNQIQRGINGREFRDFPETRADFSTGSLKKRDLPGRADMMSDNENIIFDINKVHEGSGTKQSIDGVLNHELAHNFQNYFNNHISRYSMKNNYYVPNENSPLYDVFNPLLNTKLRDWDETSKRYVPSVWAQSPDEVHSELANIKYLTGVNHISELGNWRRRNITRTLAKRFGVSFEDMDRMIIALENNGY